MTEYRRTLLLGCSSGSVSCHVPLPHFVRQIGPVVMPLFKFFVSLALQPLHKYCLQCSLGLNQQLLVAEKNHLQFASLKMADARQFMPRKIHIIYTYLTIATQRSRVLSSNFPQELSRVETVLGRNCRAAARWTFW